MTLLKNISTRQLDNAYQTCARITRREAGNFYYAFLFLPLRQRRAMEALYAFCRLGDDLTDHDAQNHKKDNPLHLIDHYQQILDDCYQGRHSSDVSLALTDTINNFQLEKRVFEDMIAGFKADLTGTHYKTFAQLEVYCQHVASTVGLHCLKIFSADTADARRYAKRLGIAMQMVNILRDIHEDYQRGRIYLPVEDLTRFRVMTADFSRRIPTDNLKNLLNFEIERTEAFFLQAMGLMPRNLKQKLIAARIMTAIYRRILAGIRIRDDLSQRVSLPPAKKISLGLWVLMGFD